MKKFTVTVEKEITIEFDDNSDEFQSLWKNYKAYFDDEATYDDFVETIASNISRYGVESFIEGIGFVKVNGENQLILDNEGYNEKQGIINVNVDTDINGMVEFETSSYENS